MKLLITGASGFIGSHFVKYFLNQGHEVVALCRGKNVGDYKRLHSFYINPKLTLHRHDLCDSYNFLLKEKNPDVILHVAASSHVDRSIIDPISFVRDNVLGTTHLLDAMNHYWRDSKMIYFSTDEVFGPANNNQAFREWDRYNCTNPYAATKAGAEEMCLAFANTYNLDIRITHCMNVFGEYQHPEKFIPLCIKRIQNREVINIHADETKKIPGSRFYIHAKKVAEAVDFILQHGTSRQKYNIVGDEEVNNLNLAERIAAIIGIPGRFNLVDFHSSRPGHDLRYALSGQLLRTMGFSFSTTFDEDLEATIKWYQKNPEWLK